MNSLPISVVINTKNEENNIERVLKSVSQWIDEIIICDMHSTDKTIEIAKSYNCVITYYDDIGYVEPARKFAIEAATNEWILLLDADEVVDSRLREWIKSTFQAPDELDFDGVELPWIQYMSGKKIEYSDFGNQRHMRLFRKSKFKFSDMIHSRRQAIGDVKIITLSKEQVGLVHFNCASFRHFLSKINHYAYVEAQDVVEEKGQYTLTVSKGIIAFVRSFVKTFIKLKGYKDGIHGLHISLCMGLYSFLVRSYANEIYHRGNEKLIYKLYDEEAEKLTSKK
ncbi:glycosyltransferase family 2 protein [Alteromonas lipolytica]|uniref:Glycosyltransferase 2-like domain-containing protein n=1 Tax=Alteromonas lipolytica TaxID=1856405 RepID=A0A1E8FDS8_9ALTE|nr:glycosyltransferase family 2 protein [Alteromonas lipolytica]OFI34069.1 hypothetical protein BFC17_21205 [Alteromonas lipolytica]